MFERNGDGASGRPATGRGARAEKAPRRALGLRFEALDRRDLPATLAPVPTIQVPNNLGYQLPLNGGVGDPQTYTVSSDNPNIKATVAQGKFLTINVNHASSGASDPAFTGSMTYQLFEDLTPVTASRIETLVQQGFYNNKVFHRVANNFPGANDFIVQGGSVNGNGTGSVNQPGFPFNDEFNQQLAFTDNGTQNPSGVAGQLAMANSGPDTNDSQFFVTTGAPNFLDFHHTIFAQLVSGFSVVKQMTQVARGGTDGTTPLSPITITSAALSSANPNGVIHIDATNASANQSANLSVTATDPTDGSKATQTFRVDVVPNNNSSGQPINERPFLQPVPNQVVGYVNGSPQVDILKLPGVATTPGDQLTYTIQGGLSGGSFTPVQNAKATVDSNGVATITPNAGFTGVINLLAGVRDQTQRSGGTSLDSPANFQTHAFTLTVNNGAPVNLQPIATPATATAIANTPTTVQLQGVTANPQSTTQTLTFALQGQPSHGTISGFNPSTGTFTYTPNADFQGTDTVPFTATDTGAPGPSLTSVPATETITVSAGATGAVRLIGRVLVVTPVPRTDSQPNNISVSQVNGAIQVKVNGQIDSNQPQATALDRIVVYGSKSSDNITIDQNVTLPATLDGGHGGNNVLIAGGGVSRLHGWFGFNTMKGGPQDDALIGRAGHVRFLKSAGRDQLFAGRPTRAKTLHHPGKAPHGTFYKFVGNRLVPIATPRPKPVKTPDLDTVISGQG